MTEEKVTKTEEKITNDEIINEEELDQVAGGTASQTETDVNNVKKPGVSTGVTNKPPVGYPPKAAWEWLP